MNQTSVPDPSPDKLIKTAQLAELERRIEFLEKDTHDLQKDLAGQGQLEKRVDLLEKKSYDHERDLPERGLKKLGIIFASLSALITFAAIWISLLGYWLRSDAQKAIENTKNDVQSAVSNMNARFEALAGESLKRPDIQILLAKGKPLNGQFFEMISVEKIGPFLLDNAGNKMTDPLNIRLDFSAGVSLVSGSAVWGEAVPMDPDFASSYQFINYGHAPVSIPANDYLSLEPITLTGVQGTTNFCRMRVFYWSGKPAEAVFKIHWK